MRNCPYCSTPCEADMVHNGVGLEQCGSYYCINCHASQIHSSDLPMFTDVTKWTTTDGRKLTLREIRTGWYAPETPVSPKANTYQGVPVKHDLAMALYREGKLDDKSPFEL